MSTLFQNGVSSEIVAGYYNGESLEGLYINGDYFQIAVKNYNMYFGRIYGIDEDTDIKPAYVNTISDENFAKIILGTAESSVAAVNESDVVVGKTPYNLEVHYGDYNDGPNVYSRDFFAFPTKLKKEGTFKIFDIGANNYVSASSIDERTLLINGEEYIVYYGFSDSALQHDVRFELAS